MPNKSQAALGKQIQEALIRELGDTTDSYPFNLSRVYVRNNEAFQRTVALATYAFSTEKNTRYDVRIRYQWNESPFASLQFQANAGGWSQTINEGSMFRVMATVLQCASDFWERRRKILMQNGDDITLDIVDRLEGFKFDISNTRDPESTSRFKLYQTFINHQFPSARIFIEEGDVFITP